MDLHASRTPSILDVAQSREPKVKTPADAIRLLYEGNARFYNGEPQRTALSAYERRLQIVTQSPFAVVLGCSDSRVPVEIVFDQGPGELFVVRVAGNVVEAGVLGTVEFAVKRLNVQTIVVMGHEGCGAVQTAMLPPDKRMDESPAMKELLRQIEPALAGVPSIKDNKARMREAVIANVRHQAHRLSENEVVQTAVRLGRVSVVGAFYEIGSGAVDFLDPE